MRSGQKPIQGGGFMQSWRNPDRSFHHLFLKLDLDCETDKYPGVMIVSDVTHSQVFLAEVENLQKELPWLLEQIEGEVIAYWSLQMDGQKRSTILSGLTEHPVFVG